MIAGAEAEMQSKGAGRGGASILSLKASGSVSLDCWAIVAISVKTQIEG